MNSSSLETDRWVSVRLVRHCWSTSFTLSDMHEEKYRMEIQVLECLVHFQYLKRCKLGGFSLMHAITPSKTNDHLGYNVINELLKTSHLYNFGISIKYVQSACIINNYLNNCKLLY